MNKKKKKIVNKKKPSGYTVTLEGSLGLLAIGDIGLRVWRKYKKSANKNINNSSEKK